MGQATPEVPPNPSVLLTVEVPDHPVGRTGPEAMTAGARNAPVVTAVPSCISPAGVAPGPG
eukprot:11080600-Alexandrium_andersonii.AAC.1